MEIMIRIEGKHCLDEGGRICPEFRMWLCDKFACKLKPDKKGLSVRCPACLALDKKDDRFQEGGIILGGVRLKPTTARPDSPHKQYADKEAQDEGQDKNK